MGSFNFRRSKTIGGVRFQLGPRRATVSKRVGPVTVSSTGRDSIRIARGIRYRFGKGWQRKAR